MDTANLSEIRELKDSELPQLNQLVSESFGYTSPHSFFDDFPVWKSKQVRRFGIFEEEKLIAHTGIRFCEMKSPNGPIHSIAMIGAVATKEHFRGKGLSTKLLNETCKFADELNCDWTLLWGSEHDFYKKFGFNLEGEQFQAPLAELDQLPENFVPRLKKGWDQRIFDYLKNSPLGVSVKDEDFTWISDHKTVSWFYQDAPFAFVGFQRGLDLPHIIHEYGGDRKSLFELFSFVLSLDSDATLLGTEKSLKMFGFNEDMLQEEYLCLARPHPDKKELKWEKDFWVPGLSAC